MEAMVTGGEVNYGIWSDAQFDSLVEQAINELEPDKMCIRDSPDGGRTGMELARDPRAENEQTSILFIASSQECLKDGYSVRPIPVSYTHLHRRATAGAAIRPVPVKTTRWTGVSRMSWITTNRFSEWLASP